MVQAIWMTDLHVTREGYINGYDARVRLEATIKYINAHYADHAFCIISGDLVDNEAEENYACVAELLDKLTIPYFPVVGNHDDRSLFRAALPLPADTMQDFIQYKVDVGDGLLVCVDTKASGTDAGGFCDARAAWLDEALTEAGDRPVYLFMHHPPMRLGLRMMDELRMEGGSVFLDLLETHGNVAHLFMGHVHRAISGAVRGIPFSTLRSIAYQSPSERPEWTWDEFKPSSEAPNICRAIFEGGDVLLQYVQCCDAELGASNV